MTVSVYVFLWFFEFSGVGCILFLLENYVFLLFAGYAFVCSLSCFLAGGEKER